MPKTIHREEHRVLANLLRELRDERGLTQADLSPLVGRPQNRVSDFERGGRRIDVIEFIDYCRALGVDPLKTFSRLLKQLSGARTSTARSKKF
jgi:transcriptional regulator with XRE-family HTH domain